MYLSSMPFLYIHRAVLALITPTILSAILPWNHSQTLDPPSPTLWATIVYDYTLPVGSGTLLVYNGNTSTHVTITEPTTYITTLTIDPGWLHAPVEAGFGSANQYCEQTINAANMLPQPTGHTTTAKDELGDDPIGGTISGAACAAFCGNCGIVFDYVGVYYWPGSSLNTGCPTSTYASAPSQKSSNDNVMKARSLQINAANISTVVNAEGHTFTSPSIYIAFSTIAAYDNCGQVGSVHTSATLAFDPSDLSTIPNPPNSLDSSSFNFADAWCLPSSTSGQHLMSLTGVPELYPFIFGLPGLSLIDSIWNNANCFVGGNQQWILPPYALTPASDVLISTTSIDPVVTTTPASPSSYRSMIPVKTHFSASYLSIMAPSSTTILSQFPTFRSQTIATQSATVQTIGSQSLFSESTFSVDSVALPSAVSASYVLTFVTTVPIEGPIASSESAAIVFEGHTYIANSLSAFVVASQTLTQGGMISIGSIVLSLPHSTSFVVEGTLITPIASGNPEIFTYAGQPYTANSASDFIVDGKTLAPGSVITISGTPISLAATPTDVVVGTSTQNLGSLIMQGIGGASRSGPTIFEGRASDMEWGMWWMLVITIALSLYQ